MLNKKPVSYKNRRIITTEVLDLPAPTDCTISIVDESPVVEPIKQRADKGKPRAKYDNSLPPRYLYYLKRANAKKMAFEFTVEQFEELCSKDCVYCGDSAYGLDRIDSKRGYTLDNCVPSCTACNMMKYTHSTNAFLKHVAKIQMFQNQRN